MTRKFLLIAVLVASAEVLSAQTAPARNIDQLRARVVCPLPSTTIIKKVKLAMPRDKSGRPLFGKVVAEVTISKSGEASRIRLVRGDARLRPAVIAALKQWKWKPFLLNDRPIEVQQTVVVNFEPR